MLSSPTYTRTTWLFKCCECALAAIAVLNILMMGLELLPRSVIVQYGSYLEYLLLGVVGVAVLGSLVYSWFWHRGEQAGNSESGIRHAWMQGIIRYWLALSIATYGFAKILKTQFQSPDFRLDTPLGEVNGFGLTWYYFGYSYTLAVIIGLIQVGGSVLLLYRRTTLLGVILLLPVMINIVLINLFYQIAPGAFFNSVMFTLGLIFLLLLDVPKLKAAFWDLVDHLPPVTLGRNWVKHALRVLPIALAFAFIAQFVFTDKSDTLLKGTWRVDQLIRNGKMLPATAWLADTTAWNRVYFAGMQGCAFSPNPYRYKATESMRGTYEFDSLNNGLTIVKYVPMGSDATPDDTLRLSIRERTKKTMRLSGIIDGDTVQMKLARLR
ncbi:hypothetical protein [Fibrella forsythiae]|uniref:ABC transporter permease n=1 Tax=Fibrella forsythiae TaxID=2817061 RepID=A0ABS3JG86_9BACT|nr:hypothetical protein [Fibrella forsythiae]MBO0948995.1 hypothetical protein [Fibrella forsythiae]